MDVVQRARPRVEGMPDVVGCHEVAARLGVQVDTVHQWRKRGLLPEAVELACGPVWLWDRVARWARATGRL